MKLLCELDGKMRRRDVELAILEAASMCGVKIQNRNLNVRADYGFRGNLVKVAWLVHLWVDGEAGEVNDFVTELKRRHARVYSEIGSEVGENGRGY